MKCKCLTVVDKVALKVASAAVNKWVMALKADSVHKASKAVDLINSQKAANKAALISSQRRAVSVSISNANSKADSTNSLSKITKMLAVKVGLLSRKAVQVLILSTTYRFRCSNE